MSFNPRPHRLDRIYQDYSPPLYFVTFCTAERAPLLAYDGVHRAFIEYAEQAMTVAAIAVGRYVIMPDHVHLFIRGPNGFQPGIWVRGLKRSISQEIRRMRTSAPQSREEDKWDTSTMGQPCGADVPIRLGETATRNNKGLWQEGMFDHIIRHSESYREKWAYVWQNPVRAGLVSHADDWPYQGEITVIDRA